MRHEKELVLLNISIKPDLEKLQGCLELDALPAPDDPTLHECTASVYRFTNPRVVIAEVRARYMYTRAPILLLLARLYNYY